MMTLIGSTEGHRSKEEGVEAVSAKVREPILYCYRKGPDSEAEQPGPAAKCRKVEDDVTTKATGNEGKGNAKEKEKKGCRILPIKPPLKKILKSGIDVDVVRSTILKTQKEGTDLIRELSGKLEEVVTWVGGRYESGYS